MKTLFDIVNKEETEVSEIEVPVKGQEHIKSAKEILDQDGEVMGEFVGDFGI